MSSPVKSSIRSSGETVDDLRRRLGLFSFRSGESRSEAGIARSARPELDLKAGMVVEWVMARAGAGAATSAVQLLARHLGGRGFYVVVDPHRETYLPAVGGWGIDPSRMLLLRPANPRETFWAIEQCLRCPGVSATCAWIERGPNTTVNRRWKLAAEKGGGVCALFRPETASAGREPAWADLRLKVTPLSGGQGDARRIRVEVLYCRGRLGGDAQVWEIDHAAGDVRLVPQLAGPAVADRAARA